jgi:hypothetical protein
VGLLYIRGVAFGVTTVYTKVAFGGSTVYKRGDFWFDYGI